ncbi:hypothetical protein DCS32_00480 [Dokdonia sp. Dokd-P16]|uniref:hypothetical protein n=1 Tax=Dokdonia sp. Dokd-P16 TaxID=2173169 RepID=UPI000D54366E|nr:hypothetical protein [Dokdonia sp. Dokd-P16]AWH72698.1 hypothetical protein DCS32_00480 [Dokdonia sp. Dokd-P16]
MRSFLLLLYLCFSVAVSANEWLPETKEPTIKILFIGNSLTYTNNLPKLVKAHAKTKGIKIKTRMVALPNYALEDHWNDGNIQQLIATGGYDYVIIQQGPSSQQEGRDILIDYGKKYAALCNKHNARLAYFMVWPSLKYYHTLDAVIKNYQDAATINNAIILPVGMTWKEHHNSSKRNDYYGIDGFHPSLKGSKAAAATIVSSLF